MLEGASLSVIDQTICRRVQQFRLSSCIESRQVGNNLSHRSSLWERQTEFALCPLRNEIWEVVWRPSGSVPSIIDEEFYFSLIRLEISNVENPETVSLTIDGNWHLFVNLVQIIIIREQFAYQDQKGKSYLLDLGRLRERAELYQIWLRMRYTNLTVIHL